MSPALGGAEGTVRWIKTTLPSIALIPEPHSRDSSPLYRPLVMRNMRTYLSETIVARDTAQSDPHQP